MLIVVLAALTLGPAVITVVTRWGCLEPKRTMRIRGWRKIGAAVVRWPGPILVATIAVSLVGLLALHLGAFATTPTSTTGTICRPTCPPTRAMRLPSGISPLRG